MKNYIKSLAYTGEEAGGQGMSEYVILLGAVTAIATAGVLVFRNQLITAFTNAGTEITKAFTNATTPSTNPGA